MKKLSNEEQIKLNDLVTIYLTSENNEEESIETDLERIDETHISFWKYAPGSQKAQVNKMDYLWFSFEFLIKKMFKGELFKFNKVMSSLILKSKEDTSIINTLWISHLDLLKAKQSTAKAIKEKKNAKESAKDL